jgi:hypothetical protein
MDDRGFSSLTIEEVEKTLIVVHSETDKKYRLEAVRCLDGIEQMFYGVRYYECNDAGVWSKYLHFPTINRDSADSALDAALQYVNDHPQGGMS